MVSKYRLFWQLMEGERLRYTAAIASLALASCCLYLVPLVPTVVIDGVIAKDTHAVSPIVLRAVEWGGGREFLRSNLWIAAVAIVGFTMLGAIFTHLRGRWAGLASEGITRRVRERLYDQLQHLPSSFYDHAQTGDLVQRCTSDVETLRMFLIDQVVEIGRATFLLLIPLPLMFAVDARMAGVSLILIPVITVFSMVFFSRVRSCFEEVDQAEGRMSSTLQENLTGIRVVRAFARQEYEIRKFAARNGEHRDLNFRLFRLLAAFWSVSDLMCMSQIALVVFAGGRWLAQGSLGAGSFLFFLMVVNMFLWPVRMMGRILTELGKATVAIGRIYDILGHPRESVPAVPALFSPALGQTRGQIAFRDVSFSHRDGKAALDGISFDAAAGRTIALLGSSGSGKSTLVNLLLKFYDPDSGTIEVDGQNIATMDRKDVRRQISVVMQEPFLFSRTLRENIVLGHAAATHHEVTEAATAACVHETILRFETGYDTLVGERGITLSGGQRQRVALARALLKRPAVLVLDDALSAVDTETETLILDALKQRRGRHTTIVIAHRLSTLKDADEILVLDRGRLVQRGAHATLKNQPGPYRRILTIQKALDEQLSRDFDDAAGAMWTEPV
jgi:ATP-binding cassette subfamily B protein